MLIARTIGDRRPSFKTALLSTAIACATLLPLACDATSVPLTSCEATPRALTLREMRRGTGTGERLDAYFYWLHVAEQPATSTPCSAAF